METAEALVASAMAADGQLLLVGGDPGIGKSRLTEEITAVASTRGGLTAWGRCWEAGGAPPYWPWIDALNALVRQVGRDRLLGALGDTAGDVAVVAPALRVGSGSAPPDDAGARFRLYEGVVDLLDAVTDLAGPALVIALDDAHTADPSSLLLLEFVASRLARRRVMLVVTYRHGELTDAHPFTATLAQLMRASSTTRLLLRGLDEGAVDELITATSGRSPRPSLARQVLERTDGNPLYVGEIARLLAAEGRLDLSDGTSMPRDVRETVLHRVARLPSETRSALEAAAVLGRDFPVDLLVAITSPEVLVDLEPAAASDLLAPVPNAIGQLRFSHAVVAQALYETITPTRRMQIHLAAARALEQRHAHDLDSVLASLALHYAAAAPVADVATGAEYARRAGERAVRQLAYEEAARLFRLAQSLLASAGVTDLAVRADLMLALGDAHARAGARDASMEAFFQAADLARELGDPERLGRAAVGYGGRFVWLRPGGDTRLVPLLEEAAAVLPRGTALWTRVVARLAGALRDEWDGRRRQALSAEALEAAVALGDPDTLALALTSRFTAVWSPDTIASHELDRLAEAAARNAMRSQDPEREGEVRWLRFILTVAANDGDTTRREIQRYGDHARRLRQPSQQWYAAVMSCIVRLMDGPLDGLEDLIDDAQQMGEYAQPWDAAASHRMAMAQLRREQGRLGEYEAALRDAVAEFAPYRLFSALLALSLVQSGRRKEALDLTWRLAGDGPDSLPFDNSWLYGMQLLAEVAYEAKEAELGERLHARLLPYADVVGQASGEIAIGSVGHHLATLDVLAGRLDPAVERFEGVLDQYRDAGASVWAARTLVHSAAALEQRDRPGDRTRAAAQLDEARELAARLGIGSVLDVLRDRSSAGRTDEPALTPRENEVARLVAEGLSNKDIAAALFVSERTVETHVQHILTKLGFSSRTQVAAWLARARPTGVDARGY